MTTEISKTPQHNADLVELFYERAAIIQYEAGKPRHIAEWQAFIEMREKYGRDSLPEEVKQIAREAAGKL